jgi:hypothetical protein
MACGSGDQGLPCPPGAPLLSPLPSPMGGPTSLFPAGFVPWASEFALGCGCERCVVAKGSAGASARPCRRGLAYLPQRYSHLSAALESRRRESPQDLWREGDGGLAALGGFGRILDNRSGNVIGGPRRVVFGRHQGPRLDSLATADGVDLAAAPIVPRGSVKTSLRIEGCPLPAKLPRHVRFRSLSTW